MIPSDHFVRFYNEVFKFLDSKPDGLADYYREIAHDQESHCLKIFMEKGLQGMYEYWDMIRFEENCDMDIKKYDDHIEFHMNKCPSLGKVTDNDAGPFERYCNHCPGWVIPLVEKAGFVCEYNIIDRFKPICSSKIYPKSSGRKSSIVEKPEE